MHTHVDSKSELCYDKHTKGQSSEEEAGEGEKEGKRPSQVMFMEQIQEFISIDVFLGWSATNFNGGSTHILKGRNVSRPISLSKNLQNAYKSIGFHMLLSTGLLHSHLIQGKLALPSAGLLWWMESEHEPFTTRRESQDCCSRLQRLKLNLKLGTSADSLQLPME